LLSSLFLSKMSPHRIWWRVTFRQKKLTDLRHWIGLPISNWISKERFTSLEEKPIHGVFHISKQMVKRTSHNCPSRSELSTYTVQNFLQNWTEFNECTEKMFWFSWWFDISVRFGTFSEMNFEANEPNFPNFVICFKNSCLWTLSFASSNDLHRINQKDLQNARSQS
jgi:hypothetical protein